MRSISPTLVRFASVASVVLALAGGMAGCVSLGSDPNERLVDIREVDPRIVIDIRYATPNNFTHATLYPVGRCLLRENVARRLAWVESDLSLQGLGIKVFDCYRPRSVQYKMWKIVPDSRYVADPNKGSRHNRGAAVDLTLVDLRAIGGPRELEMPTGFDDFTEKAHRDYQGATGEALLHRRILEEAMQRRGFVGLSTEWWHFDAKGWERYPLLDIPLDAVK